MNKKGFVKTLEMLFAVSIVFIFLIFILPRVTKTETEESDLNFLNALIENATFRAFVLNENNASVNSSISDAIAQENLMWYNYTFTISSNPNFAPKNLPDKKITTLSAIISSNNTQYTPKVIRIYLWKMG